MNFVLHAAGWLEGGLIAGYEKFILDLEMCGMMARFVNGIGLTDEDFAWDAYAEVGPGQHFLGAQHTMRHYETAFYQHTVFNMDNYEKWEEEGSVDTYQRANAHLEADAERVRSSGARSGHRRGAECVCDAAAGGVEGAAGAN